MCFGNMQPTQQTNGATSSLTNSNSTTNSAGSSAQMGSQDIGIDPTLRDQATTNTDYLTGTRDAGYTPYAGSRSAAVSGTGENNMATLDRMATPWIDPMVEQGYQHAQAYANAPASTVNNNFTTRWVNDPGRVVDENGRLGAISDYTSPYIKQVLDPQLQDLDEEGYRRNKEMNSRAAMAGAFGDTGWEFGRAREADLTRRQRGSAIANANQNAWDRAMALRGQDSNRFVDTDKFNSNLQEQASNRLLDADKFNATMQEAATERQLKAADWMGKFGIMNSQNQQSILSALDKAGTAFQTQNQKDLDAAYQEFSRQTGFPLEVSQMLVNAINGSPLNRAISSDTTQDGATNNTSNTATTGNTVGTTTGQTQAPNNTGFNLLGTLLGGLF